MCQACHEESDDDYEGNSIEAQRNKATRSIINRHPELGLDPDEVEFRFAPKAEWECVRAQIGPGSPRYRIHVPSYTAQMMSRTPSLQGIAMAAWIETDKRYEEICSILDLNLYTPLGAAYVSTQPPLNPARADAAPGVREYEEDVQEMVDRDPDE